MRVPSPKILENLVKEPHGRHGAVEGILVKDHFYNNIDSLNYELAYLT